MTKEEAIEILQGAIKKPNTKDGYLGQAIEMAIKALEQEPILGKIRAEIESLERFEIRGEKTPLINGDNVLQIIDKYKTDKE